MKKLLLSMLVLVAIISNAQNINIPDANFKGALIEAGVDINADGEISHDEAKAISELDVYDRNISDLTGIEAFVNLVSLKCDDNQLTSLNLSDNTSLESLACGENKLTSLDVLNNTALIVLGCAYNQLIILDVSNNSALENLLCYTNKLTSLDVSNNIALISLSCGENQIDSLDISNNITLTELYCSDNKITGLDLSNNHALSSLSCGENLITGLDLSNNPALSSLTCGENHLTSLDISNNIALVTLSCSETQLTGLNIFNNTALEQVYLSDMPTLNTVCVWETPFPPGGVSIDTTNSPNVNFTTDCAVGVLDAYIESSKIDIYPNPSDDIINIEIEIINNAIIEIYNASGNLIFSNELNSMIQKIDVSGFSEGIYIVKIKQEHNVKVEKLIVY